MSSNINQPNIAKYKCQLCKTKIKFYLVQSKTCRCGGLYCDSHTQHHNCSFDFKGHFKDNYAFSEKIEAIKVDII